MQVPEQPSDSPAHRPSASSSGSAADRPADGAGAAGNDEPHAQHDDTGDGAPHGSAVGRAAKTTSRVSVATGRGIGRASRAAFKQARRFTHALGAGEIGVYRLYDLHGHISVCYSY